MQIESLSALTPARRSMLLERGRSRLSELLPAVETIIAAVRDRGDTALIEFTKRFDHVNDAPLVAAAEEFSAARASVAPEVQTALQLAATNIATAHQAQLPQRRSAEVETQPGVRIWREWRAIERVGIYAPGGGARYPSSVLMCAIPARLAGCQEIVLCTPPGPDGRVPPELLIAAEIAGVTRVCAVGGAQAIAALAFGTESVPRVDKIVGPGSSYVAAAKLVVAREVAIDMPAGPSEVLVVADAGANAAWVAADLLAQAEHGPESACLAVLTDRALAEAVQQEIESQLALLPTADTIRASLALHGALLLADSLDDALAFVNAFAAEHLSLAVRDPQAALPHIQQAGSVFLGDWSPVAAGDYATGGNHTLPTAGFARSYGPLAIEAFGRWMQVQSLDSAGLAALHTTVECLATAEGLPAHAASVAARFSDPMALPAAQYSSPVRLHANEAPWGPPPHVLAAIAATARQANHYPDHEQRDLRQALARLNGVQPEQIIAGNGSDEILHLIALLLLRPGDVAVLCEPTFGMYRLETERRGAQIVDVPLDADFLIDRAALLAAITPATRLVWLCSPNNPTGTPSDLEVIPELLARGLWVIVDEAYYPFGNLTALPYLGGQERLIIVRTLSKSGAMAGLRLGYAISAAETIARLDALRQPYNVNALASAAALALLAEPAWLTERVAQISGERIRIAALLAQLPGVRVWPSVANFVLVELPVNDGAFIVTQLAEQGVLVRHYPHPRLRRCLRITSGTAADNDRMYAALTAVLTTVPEEMYA